jgi:putative pyruvate formate lyase activating enzyme
MSNPSYSKLLATGELQRRVTALETLLERCTVCPRDCLNNRLRNEIAACYSGRLPIVSSYTAHFGEEPALVGTRGAGNIFFRQLQFALRLLPELPDLTNAQRATQE